MSQMKEIWAERQDDGSEDYAYQCSYHTDEEARAAAHACEQHFEFFVIPGLASTEGPRHPRLPSAHTDSAFDEEYSLPY